MQTLTSVHDPYFSVENGFSNPSLGYNEKGRNRGNARFEKFMRPNADRLRGKRVLDLASHDGRWTYAALALGAAEVVGVEIRQHLIDSTADLVPDADFKDRATFLQGDLFDVLPRLIADGERFDVVLNLGIFYHVMDHFRLMTLMHAFDPEWILLDTGLDDSDDSFIRVQTETSEHFLNGVSYTEDAGADAVIGVVSRGALDVMANALGYDVTYLDWNRSEYENPTLLSDYFAKKRFTTILDRRERQIRI